MSWLQRRVLARAGGVTENHLLTGSCSAWRCIDVSAAGPIRVALTWAPDHQTDQTIEFDVVRAQRVCVPARSIQAALRTLTDVDTDVSLVVADTTGPSAPRRLLRSFLLPAGEYSSAPGNPLFLASLVPPPWAVAVRMDTTEEGSSFAASAWSQGTRFAHMNQTSSFRELPLHGATRLDVACSMNARLTFVLEL